MAANNWYWIDGSAYCPACVECDTPAIDSADATRGPCTSGRCACCGTEPCKTYYIAVYEGFNQDTIHIVEQFEAASDEAANAYAEANHADLDWYVLDSDRENINV